MMSSDSLREYAETLEKLEVEVGLEALGDLLAKSICAVSARTSNETPKIWPVSTDLVEGEVHVVFGPGDELLDKLNR